MKKSKENYLERIPRHPDDIEWSQEDGQVTLHVENKGFYNRLLQKIAKKPKVSHIHLDEIGSFVWPLIDGKKNIIEIGVPVEEHFGEKVHPTYERLAKFFKVLEGCKFVEWVQQ